MQKPPFPLLIWALFIILYRYFRNMKKQTVLRPQDFPDASHSQPCSCADCQSTKISIPETNRTLTRNNNWWVFLSISFGVRQVVAQSSSPAIFWSGPFPGDSFYFLPAPASVRSRGALLEISRDRKSSRHLLHSTVPVEFRFMLHPGHVEHPFTSSYRRI